MEETRRRGRDNVTTETDFGVMWPQAQENWGSHQNLEEARNVFSPRGTPGSIALLDLNF